MKKQSGFVFDGFFYVLGFTDNPASKQCKEILRKSPADKIKSDLKRMNSDYRKKLFTIIILMASLSCIAQEWPIDKETGKITFTKVVQVDSASKSVLYNRAMEWFAKTYNSSKDVLQIEDKEAGKLYGKALLSVYVTQIDRTNWGSVHYEISITVKDNRYKYTITNLYHEGNRAAKGTSAGASGGNLENEKPECGWIMNKKCWSVIKQQTYDYMIEITSSLKDSMSKPNASTKENW